MPSKKNPPVGPLSGNVAAHTIPFAPSSTGRPRPLPPMFVDTHPGSTELTKVPVPESSAARIRVNAFRAALRRYMLVFQHPYNVESLLHLTHLQCDHTCFSSL